MSTIQLANMNGEPEIFYSIQGEGMNIGVPCIFIRLSLCNLYCKWCDTAYTWNWTKTTFVHDLDTVDSAYKFDKKQAIISKTNDQIIELLKQYNCKHVVITGGEPLVQHKVLTNLLKTLKEKGYYIEVETNGTIIPNRICASYFDQFNVSIKLSNSQVDTDDRIIPSAITYFIKDTRSNFKFVIDSKEDLQEVIELIKTYSIPKHSVFLMPQAIQKETLHQKRGWLIEQCKILGVRYTDRLHVEVYGDKRGV